MLSASNMASSSAAGPGEAAAPAAEAQQLAAQAADLAAGGEYAAAASLFERALEVGPAGDAAAAAAAAAVHEMLAQCRMAMGEDEGAYEAAAEAVRLRPRWRPALLTLGRAARNAGRLREAADALGSYVTCSAAAGAVAAKGAGAGLLGAAAAPDAVPAASESAAATTEAAEAAATAAATAEEGTAGPSAVAANRGEDGGAEEQEQSEEEEEEASAAQELEEVENLLQLQLGHQLGLPGLRLLEQRGSAIGPASVAWEAGALLAWFLVRRPSDACAQAAAEEGGGSGDAGGCSACEQPPNGDAGAGCRRCGPGSGSDVAGPAAPPSPNESSGSLWRGRRVLELGAGGTGLVGLAAACLGAHVVATDLPEVLPHLQSSAALNSSMVAAAGGSLTPAVLDWRQPDGPVLQPEGPAERQYEWLLGADLVYSLPSVVPLAATVAAAAAHAAARGGAPLRILIAHKHRHEEVDGALLGALRSAGVTLRALLRDAGSRCTVYANDAAAAALRSGAR